MADRGRGMEPGEELVVRLRRHPTSLLAPVLVVAGAALAAGVVSSFVPDPARGPATALAWVLAAGAIAWWAVRPALDAVTARHDLTDRRLVAHHGVVARRRSGAPVLEVPLHTVEAVDVEAGLLGRLVGSGTLVVHRTADPSPVRLRDLPDIARLRLLVGDLVEDAHGVHDVPDEHRRDTGGRGR